MNKPASTKTKARLTLVALLAVFVLPLTLAWVFALGPLEWRPAITLNYGVLLDPPLQLKSYGVVNSSGAELGANAIARDWFLVVLHDSACTIACVEWMQTAERIQVATGRDAGRISLALLSPDEDAPDSLGQSWWLPTDSTLVEELQRVSGETQLDTILLIVDYRGHVVLMYPPTEDGRGVIADLERLLRPAAS